MSFKDFVLKNTIVAKKENVIKSIRESILIWRQNKTNKKIYINLSTDKIGSEQWLYLEVKDLLPEHTIIQDEYCKIEDHCEILYIDDICLSGYNACMNFRDFFKHRSLKDVHYNFIFYGATNEGYNLIRNYSKEFYSHFKYACMNTIIIPRMDEIMQDKNITFPETEIKEFHKIYSTELDDYLHPFYSDYKIPNNYGSYTKLYEEIYTPNRKFMKAIIEKWIKEFLYVK